MAVIAIIMSVNLTACSDDDEDSTPTAEKLAGQWVLTHEEGYEKEPSEPEYDREWNHAPKDECEYYGNFLFRADGTFVESDLDNSELQRGKWTLSNNLLTLREQGYEYYYEEEDGGVEYAKMTYKRK